MAVLLKSSSRVIALAATGAYGRHQLSFMKSAGTNLVGLVALGRGGQQDAGLPVFENVQAAVDATGADTAVVYTPPAGVRAAVVECSNAGIRLAYVAAEYVPVHDTLYAVAYARERGMAIAGPNSAGMATPGEAMLGAIAPGFTLPGSVGLMGRSGTLTMFTARFLSEKKVGQSTVIHIGGDGVIGMNPDKWLELFLQDDATSHIVYVGEIGGHKEYAFAEAVARSGKPVTALIAGRHAPVGKQMGHAGALIGSDRETAAAKRGALREAGAVVCDSPMELADCLQASLAARAEAPVL